MSSAQSFLKNLKSDRVFLDSHILLSALSEDEVRRQKNLPFLLITTIAPATGLALITSDFCQGNARHNRGAIIKVIFEENERLIYEHISVVRSGFDHAATGIQGIHPSAPTNLTDAKINACGYLLTADTSEYDGLTSGAVEVVTPETLYSKFYFQ